MPPFPGNPDYRQLLAVHSTRNGVPLEDRIRDGTGQPPVEEPEVSRETPPAEEPETEPPPQAAKRRR
jgi:hypothetical protein